MSRNKQLIEEHCHDRRTGQTKFRRATNPPWYYLTHSSCEPAFQKARMTLREGQKTRCLTRPSCVTLRRRDGASEVNCERSYFSHLVLTSSEELARGFSTGRYFYVLTILKTSKGHVCSMAQIRNYRGGILSSTTGAVGWFRSAILDISMSSQRRAVERRAIEVKDHDSSAERAWVPARRDSRLYDGRSGGPIRLISDQRPATATRGDIY